MSTAAPVFGLRPFLELRSRTRKLPKPRSSIFSPPLSVSTMLSKIISTSCSASFLVISASFATFSTRSAFVILIYPLKSLTIHAHYRRSKKAKLTFQPTLPFHFLCFQQPESRLLLYRRQPQKTV